MEIKEIRQKYQPNNPPKVLSEDDVKTLRSSKSICNILTTDLVSFRQRIRANQKQKSLISIARWALRDARKFDDKVKRLKGLIDGLEDISRISGISPQPQLQDQASDPTSIQEDESPPPYSAMSRPARSRPRIANPVTTTQLTFVPTSRFSTDLLENHHTVMKRFLAALPSGADHPVPKAREKLIKLTEQQFKELRIDVYDELVRRQKREIPISTPKLHWLPHVASAHPKRNEARRKLSTLLPSRFGHLVTDVVRELERRAPHLKGHPISSPTLVNTAAFPDPFLAPRNPETRRWGCVRPHALTDAPPPLLQYRPAHESTLVGTAISADISQPPHQHSLTRSAPLTIPSPPFIRRGTRGPSIEIFKSFRVSMDDPTWKVLPAALKRYNINAPWETYALYVVFKDQERCLGLEEKPLVLFKRLDRDGLKPMFMLRRIKTRGEGRMGGCVV